LPFPTRASVLDKFGRADGETGTPVDAAVPFIDRAHWSQTDRARFAFDASHHLDL